ncbi:MAG: peptidylprolyl isomerase [Prevotellaceae bacterium]|jgi:peptidylprolyl isomerase|nr:peptidylprolyl isomerase [Prevotellaceae bacterium]
MKVARTVLTVFLIVASAINGYSQKKYRKMNEKVVKIETSMGNVVVKLYNETPQHRDNFIKLIKEKFYDGVIFHRVIKDFMIQTGDPDSKNPVAETQYGMGDPGYTIPAEINLKYIHKKGALSAARTADQVNPERRSSGSQFYLVQGRTITDQQLNQVELSISQQPLQKMFNDMLGEEENRLKKQGIKIDYDALINEVRKKVLTQWETMKKFKYTPEQRETYKTIGGTPFLDGQYTVFGEVLEGLDVIDKIANVETASADRPKTDVFVKKITLLN